MNKQTLHILHVYFSQEWQLSSIIYSLLFLFCILFIVSTQNSGISSKKSKKRRLDIVARHSNLVTVAKRKTRQVAMGEWATVNFCPCIGFQTLLRTKSMYTVCTKFSQNPLKDVHSRVLTKMLCSKNLTQ